MKILWFNKDYIKLNSGYAKAQREVIPRILNNSDHEIDIVCTVGIEQHFPDEWVVGNKKVRIYPGLQNKLTAEDIIEDHFKKAKADLLFIWMDSWIFRKLPKMPIAERTIFYTPIDYYPVPNFVADDLRNYLGVVTMCNWAKEVLEKEHQLENVFGYIYHGVNTDFYKPLADSKEEIKEKFAITKKSLGADKDDFLISIIAANQTRKNWPQMFEGIKIFIENNPDIKTKIYCHTQHSILEGGFNIPELANFYGLSDKMNIANPALYFWSEYEEEEMARIYNVSDVTMGGCAIEGFGFPTIESLACGTPSIGIDFGATQELLRPIAPELLVKIANWQVFMNVLRKPIPDPYDIADKLEKIANKDPEHYFKKHKIIQKYFDWDNIVKNGFIPLFERAEEILDKRCVNIPVYKTNKKVEVIE